MGVYVVRLLHQLVGSGFFLDSHDWLLLNGDFRPVELKALPGAGILGLEIVHLIQDVTDRESAPKHDDD